jgi:hypothetical protein
VPWSAVWRGRLVWFRQSDARKSKMEYVKSKYRLRRWNELVAIQIRQAELDKYNQYLVLFTEQVYNTYVLKGDRV